LRKSHIKQEITSTVKIRDRAKTARKQEEKVVERLKLEKGIMIFKRIPALFTTISIHGNSAEKRASILSFFPWCCRTR